MNAELRPKNFKSLLQEELIQRCRKNPQYSLRSFAKTLNVSPAALSDMLKGKRKITPRSIEKFGFALGLRLSDIEKFKKEIHGEVENRLDFQQLTLDQYSLISDWYHYAILELIKIDEISLEAPYITKALGITKSEANIAIERLIRLGLLEENENGLLEDTSSGFSTNISGNLTSAGSKQLQEQILKQSIDALKSLSIDVRNHTSMTMAMDPALLPEAIEKIKKFRRELSEFLETTSKPKEVYQLSMSLFPVTQISKLNQGDSK